MIGVYDDEEMSGAERFLDRQFGQSAERLAGLGHYPGRLGTSVFVEPGRDVPTISEPIGAHLVGLGSSLTLRPAPAALRCVPGVGGPLSTPVSTS
jgi:hypothetical protein